MLSTLLLTNAFKSTASASRTQLVSEVLTKYVNGKSVISHIVLPSRAYTIRVNNIRLITNSTFLRTILSKSKSLGKISARRNHQYKFNINTNVQNNVLLFKYDAPTHFLCLRIFAFVQFFPFLTLMYYCYSAKFWTDWRSDMNMRDYLEVHGVRLLLFGTALIMAPSILGVIVAVNARTIKSIILNKGGKIVSIVTYNMLKSKSVLTVPVNKVRTRVMRSDMKHYIPIQIKGRFGHFTIDSKGKFVNPELYDHTVGIMKNWS